MAHLFLLKRREGIHIHIHVCASTQINRTLYIGLLTADMTELSPAALLHSALSPAEQLYVPNRISSGGSCRPSI